MGLCFGCWESVFEGRSPNCYSLLLPASLCLPTSHLPIYQKEIGNSWARGERGIVLSFQGAWHHPRMFPLMTRLLCVPRWQDWHIQGGGLQSPQMILVPTEVWKALMQMAISGTQKALISMPNGGPGLCSDLAGATLAGREKQPRLSVFQGPSPDSPSCTS